MKITYRNSDIEVGDIVEYSGGNMLKLGIIIYRPLDGDYKYGILNLRNNTVENGYFKLEDLSKYCKLIRKGDDAELII